MAGNFRHILKFLTEVRLQCLLLPVLLYGTMAEARIRWDDGQNIVVSGNGCRNQSEVMYISAGDGFSMIMTSMNIHLSGENGSLSASRECYTEVPATVMSGYYVGSLTSDVYFGFLRTTETFGYVGLRLGFLYHGFRYKEYIGAGGYSGTSEPVLTMRNVSDFSSVFGGQCQGRDFKTSLKAELQIFAKRLSFQDSILLQADGLDIRVDINGIVRDCRDRSGR